MVKQRFLSFFVALLFLNLAIVPVSQAADSHAESLYRDAVLKETGERDPEAAVQLYKQVIDEAGNDHRLVSKALLRIGGCYELLGKSKEAEEIYLQIIQESSASLAEAVQAAQANLEKLQNQEKKTQEILQEKMAQEQLAKIKPMVLVREFQPTRFTASAGPSIGRTGTDSLAALSLAVRYRISSSSRPLALYGEVGASLPIGNAQFANQAVPFNAQTTDIASLKINYQTHLALIAELPHGHQTKVIPEMGVGAALTCSEIQYTSGSSGNETNKNWSPYLTAGLHVFPQRRVSLLIQGAYTPNPYSTSIQISNPAHTQSFGFPTSLWTVAAIAQIKIGWTKTVLRAKE